MPERHCADCRRFDPYASAVVLILSLTGVLAGNVCHAQAQPNIIVILTDDQGWTDTSIHMDPGIPESKSDYYLTPNLELLAAGGMRFSNAYSPAPVCAPSRSAIQTGKSPAQLQITANVESGDINNFRFPAHQSLYPLTPPMPRTSVPLNEVTIAERVKQANPNYRTAHYGKWHLNVGVQNFKQQGYDEGGRQPADPILDPKATTVLTNLSMSFMEMSVTQARPFFLQVSYQADHTPILATQPTIDKYSNLTPGVRHTDPVYAAMNEELDTGIGQLLQKIQDLGIQDNTYIFYTSDNGGLDTSFATNNDPLYSGKGRVWEGGLRVPFIVKGPGIVPGTVSDIPVIGMDLFPTISELVGATEPLPDGIEGTSLLPILHNGGVLPANMNNLQRAYGPNGELFFHSTHYVPASAIRDGDFKLVKVYGEPGQPDQLFLFNLSQNITESQNPNSALNLANAMPQKTNELLAKLEAWLDAVDASLPYDVAENVSIQWNADQPGTIPNGWRSTTNHDYLFRELWESSSPSPLGTIPVNSSMGGLPGQAFDFNTGEMMRRKFFHVASIDSTTRDIDHSASIEMWVKLDDLIQNRILFESGDAIKGLSLTLGDADADGLHDDLRFRLLDEDGTSLTVNAPFGAGIDPTAEYVQIVSVLNDDPADRYAAIYINGQEVARVNGVNGTDPMDWDGFDEAGLGGIAGAGLGGNGGVGDLPFIGSGLLGQIALLQFDNFALSPADVLARFDAIAFLRGDLNGNGFVGIDDLNIVLNNWNQGVTIGDPLQGDPSNDGYVGIEDLNLILGNWNAGTPPGVAGIPEPSVLGMMGLWGAGSVLRRGYGKRIG